VPGEAGGHGTGRKEGSGDKFWLPNLHHSKKKKKEERGGIKKKSLSSPKKERRWEAKGRKDYKGVAVDFV